MVPGVDHRRVEVFTGERGQEDLCGGHRKEEDVADDEDENDPLEEWREQGVDGADEVAAESQFEFKIN